MSEFDGMSAAGMAQALLNGSAAVQRVDRDELSPPIFSVDLLERLEQEYPERAPQDGEEMLAYNRYLGKRELIKVIREWSVRRDNAEN